MDVFFKKFCGILLSLNVVSAVLAETNIREQLSRANEKLSLADEIASPVCGLYSVARAFELTKKSFDINDFFSHKYITSDQGSTPSDLLRMVEDAGGNAYPLVRLTYQDIKLAKLPFVANVRLNRRSPAYDHWVCVIYDGHSGELLYFDGHRPALAVNAGEFLAMWNGYGLFIDPHRHYSPAYFQALIWIQRILPMGLLFGPLGLLLWWLGNREALKVSSKLGLIAGVSLLAYFFLTYVAYSLADWESGLKKAYIVGRGETTFESFSLTELEEAASDDDVLLIDCRHASSFRYGTIPGAINIPIDISDFGLDALFRDVPKSTKIVLFCQSAQCPYSKTMANRLSDLGFENIKVSDDGLREYNQMLAKRMGK